MSTPTTDGDDVSDDVKEALEDRAEDVLEYEEYVTFEAHNEERDED